MSTDDVTVSIDVGDTSDEVHLPAGVIDLFNEGGDPEAEVVGDILQIAFAQRAHAVVHHGEGEVGDEVREIEQATLDRFEERFGQTYAEATGHSH